MEGAFCFYVAYLFGVRCHIFWLAGNFLSLDESETAESKFIALRNILNGRDHKWNLCAGLLV